MVFSTLLFIFIFLVAVIGVYYLIPNRTYRNVVLLVFSIAFYGWGEPVYIIIMFALAVFVFGCAKICEMKGISFRILEQLPDVFLSFFAAAVAALSMLMSYFVTLRIVRNKEW